MILMWVISTVGEIKDVMFSGLTGVAPMAKDVYSDMKNISARAQLYLWALRLSVGQGRRLLRALNCWECFYDFNCLLFSYPKEQNESLQD